MEDGENILDAIHEEYHDDDDGTLDDVEMADVEEGELIEHENHESQQNGAVQDINVADKKPKPNNRNRRRRAKKKKNKGLGVSEPIDIDRFVIDTCRRLKEKKSYMLYTAIGCLGVSALSDLVKEVDAIQACGGQKTTDGKRSRTGGGVLWNIIKVREPNAYNEIMKKAREFEKQFRQPSAKQPPMQKKENSSQGVPCTFSSGHQSNVSDNPSSASQMQDQHEQSGSEDKRISVHDRLRIPVSYDDDLLAVSVDNDAT